MCGLCVDGRREEIDFKCRNIARVAGDVLHWLRSIQPAGTWYPTSVRSPLHYSLLYYFNIYIGICTQGLLSIRLSAQLSLPIQKSIIITTFFWRAEGSLHRLTASVQPATPGNSSSVCATGER